MVLHLKLGQLVPEIWFFQCTQWNLFDFKHKKYQILAPLSCRSPNADPEPEPDVLHVHLLSAQESGCSFLHYSNITRMKRWVFYILQRNNSVNPYETVLLLLHFFCKSKDTGPDEFSRLGVALSSSASIVFSIIWTFIYFIIINFWKTSISRERYLLSTSSLFQWL